MGSLWVHLESSPTSPIKKPSHHPLSKSPTTLFKNSGFRVQGPNIALVDIEPYARKEGKKQHSTNSCWLLREELHSRPLPEESDIRGFDWSPGPSNRPPHPPNSKHSPPYVMALFLTCVSFCSKPSAPAAISNGTISENIDDQGVAGRSSKGGGNLASKFVEFGSVVLSLPGHDGFGTS